MRIQFQEPAVADHRVLYIIDIVAGHYGYQRLDLLGPRGPARLATARMLAMTLAQKYTNLSREEVAAQFGGRSGSSVRFSKHRIEDLCDVDPAIRSDYQKLDQQILTSNPASKQKSSHINKTS